MTGTLNFDILLRDHIDGYRRLGWNGWCENLKPIVTNLKKLSPKNRASRGLKSIVVLSSVVLNTIFSAQQYSRAHKFIQQQKSPSFCVRCLTFSPVHVHTLSVRPSPSRAATDPLPRAAYGHTTGRAQRRSQRTAQGGQHTSCQMEFSSRTTHQLRGDGRRYNYIELLWWGIHSFHCYLYIRV